MTKRILLITLQGTWRAEPSTLRKKKQKKKQHCSTAHGANIMNLKFNDDNKFILILCSHNNSNFKDGRIRT